MPPALGLAEFPSSRNGNVPLALQGEGIVLCPTARWWGSRAAGAVRVTGYERLWQGVVGPQCWCGAVLGCPWHGETPLCVLAALGGNVLLWGGGFSSPMGDPVGSVCGLALEKLLQGLMCGQGGFHRTFWVGDTLSPLSKTI